MEPRDHSLVGRSIVVVETTNETSITSGNPLPSSLKEHKKVLFFEIPPSERRVFRDEHAQQDDTLLLARSHDATPCDLWRSEREGSGPWRPEDRYNGPALHYGDFQGMHGLDPKWEGDEGRGYYKNAAVALQALSAAPRVDSRIATPGFPHLSILEAEQLESVLSGRRDAGGLADPDNS